MFCPVGFDHWLTTIMQHLSHLSKPQATVLALWSFGMVIARSCALTAGSHVLAKGMQRKEPTVRQQRREWSYNTPRKRGPKRQALHVETCFAPLLGWVVSWWQQWEVLQQYVPWLSVQVVPASGLPEVAHSVPPA